MCGLPEKQLPLLLRAGRDTLPTTFLKVADFILDTEALAVDKASKTVSNMPRWSAVKKDCRNSIIKGSKIKDNLADSLKCGTNEPCSVENNCEISVLTLFV